MKKTLKEMRESRGVVKKALINLLDTSYPTYQKYEENPKLMTLEQINKVCDFLHCSREDIFLD